MRLRATALGLLDRYAQTHGYQLTAVTSPTGTNANTNNHGLWNPEFTQSRHRHRRPPSASIKKRQAPVLVSATAPANIADKLPAAHASTGLYFGTARVAYPPRIFPVTTTTVTQSNSCTTL